MPDRILIDRARHFKAKPLVKGGGLEVVCLERDLSAAAGPGLGLDRAHQARAMALLAQFGGDVEKADVAGSPPSPAKDAADRRPVIVPQEGGKQLTIANARGLFVEVADPGLEPSNVLRL